jgi:hypothetical protein
MGNSQTIIALLYSVILNSRYMFEKLKAKWGIESNWQVVAILIVFSLAGSSIVWARKFAFSLLGITQETELWIRTIAWLVVFFPVYQLFLLLFGFLFGQFSFFWEKEKKMMRAIGRIFVKKQ